MLVEPGFAHALGHLFAALASLLIGQRGVALLDGLIDSNLLVLDETVLPEVLLTFLLLLGLEVSGVGGVAPFGVAMLALDVVVILGLLNHDNLVDTTLTSGSDGANVQVNVVTLALTGVPCVEVNGLVVVGVMVVMVSMVLLALVPGITTPGVEGEGVHERLSGTALAGLAGQLGSGSAGKEDNQANLKWRKENEEVLQ